MVKVVLEDKGQDLLWLKVNEGGLVEEAGPFQNKIWKGSYVPYWAAKVGQLCPIHSYPHIIRGFLKYKIESIEKEP
jgi:hypothetical protein